MNKFKEYVEDYKGFKIYKGALLTGEFAFEAVNEETKTAFFRKHKATLIDAINFYSSTNRIASYESHTDSN